LRRAIQRYIEDPLADFVLRAELPSGSTVMVEPAEEGSEEPVKLTVIEAKPAPTPVGVGAEGGSSDEDDAAGAAPELEAPDAPPAADD